MAAIDFPTSPALGDFFQFGTRTWSWNGTGWARVANQNQVSSAWQQGGPFVETMAVFPIANYGWTLLTYV